MSLQYFITYYDFNIKINDVIIIIERTDKHDSLLLEFFESVTDRIELTDIENKIVIFDNNEESVLINKKHIFNMNEYIIVDIIYKLKLKHELFDYLKINLFKEIQFIVNENYDELLLDRVKFILPNSTNYDIDCKKDLDSYYAILDKIKLKKSYDKILNVKIETKSKDFISTVKEDNNLEEDCEKIDEIFTHIMNVLVYDIYVIDKDIIKHNIINLHKILIKECDIYKIPPQFLFILDKGDNINLKLVEYKLNYLNVSNSETYENRRIVYSKKITNFEDVKDELLRREQFTKRY